MRKYAFIKENEKTKKIMIYECKEGVYLFLYDSLKDVAAFADYWFESLEEVYEYIKEDFIISDSKWYNIDDPKPYCQHDFIRPVRIKGRADGNPQWGKYEEQDESGHWVDFKEAN
ncbi:hypothetical protein MRY82_04920 [bacterium]|nr:hypothetical protein [bacterium]